MTSTGPEAASSLLAKTFTLNDRIFSEGEEGDCMYIVKEGEVDLIYKGKYLTTVQKGGIFGEMALIDFHERSATAIAKTDCSLVPVDEHHFTRLVQDTPVFALQVMRVLVQRLRLMNERT